MDKSVINPFWENNELQFARLLSELRACGHMTVDPTLNADLCHSMDLEPELIDELFDRAETLWEKLKEEMKWTSQQ